MRRVGPGTIAVLQSVSIGYRCEPLKLVLCSYRNLDPYNASRDAIIKTFIITAYTLNISFSEKELRSNKQYTIKPKQDENNHSRCTTPTLWNGTQINRIKK